MPSHIPSAAPSKRPTRMPTRKPTSPPLTTEVLTCTGANQRCECDGTRQCTIVCDGADDCKDSDLICPEGHDCSIVCAEVACNKARITGPKGHDFSIYCDGDAACVDAKVNSQGADHVMYSCGGKDACKGAHTMINCGNGFCELLFTGESSGSDAKIFTNNATAFECVGRYAPCPDNYQEPCNTGLQCAPAQLFNDQKCTCECPARAEGTNCPRNFKWDSTLCDCVVDCPYAPPTEEECAYFGLVPRDCSCVPSNHCCLTKGVNNPKSWRGLCWQGQSEKECMTLSSDLCEWNERQCLPNPPVNDFMPDRACYFREQMCRWDGDCCSEYCALDGLCR